MAEKVTIQDIADALGISRNTVSKAINNTPGIADDTKEKILQKAVEMGYKQFSYVRSMAKPDKGDAMPPVSATGYQGEIALLTTCFLGNSHFASLMLDKFQREIALLGYSMNTHRVLEEQLQTKTLPITFVPERTVAMICFEMFDWDYDRMLCDLGIPVLFVDGPVKRHGRSLPADQLYMNNIDELTSFLTLLISRGKTKLGFIGDKYHCQSFYERYIAYQTAMLTAKLPVNDNFYISAGDAAGIQTQLAALPELPEVFVCANDFVAVDAVNALTALGKRVPEDVQLIGFDDSAESRACRPPLTTVHIHTQVMAYEAAHLLISRIREPSLDFRTIYTETDLIVRGSTPME